MVYCIVLKYAVFSGGIMKGKKKVQGTCDSCEFYDYDEYTDTYSCRVNLDEDEQVRFLAGRTNGCPYYRFFDEYKSIVNKQI